MPPTEDQTNVNDGLEGATDLLLDSKALGDDTDEQIVLGRLQVMVIGESTFATVTLPGPGTFIIGRHRSCTVTIDDSSISRRHAALHVAAHLSIEDLGSANGTRVNNQPIERGKRVRIALGEIVGVGKTTIIVQQRSTMLRPRRVWTHDDFEARLVEECARSDRSGAPLALLRIQTPGTAANVVHEILAELLRQSDVVGAYGPESHEVLLPDTPSDRAEEVGRRITGRLSERGIACTLSAAHFPHEGRSAHTLLGRLAQGTGTAGSHHEIIVRDPVMMRLHGLADRVAQSDIGLLVLGETGVGKDVFATRVHQSSQRASKVFLQLNCAGLTETMLDSELFGHEKGAFTGAVASKAGLLETADGGTVFLDEIGDMPHATQAKLLRVIEDRQVRRVGGLKSKAIDVRFIAATNRDLDAAVAAGTFRRDLYFRLNGVTVVIPPLRARPAEIEPLARLFAARAAAGAGIPEPAITAEALERLRAYAWPGNVRELKNVISRAVILSTDHQIDLSSLPLEKFATLVTGNDATLADLRVGPANAAVELHRRQRRGPEEAEWIRKGLEAAGGNQTRAAKLLGISRRTLINRLEAYGFERPRKDTPDRDDETPDGDDDTPDGDDDTRDGDDDSS